MSSRYCSVSNRFLNSIDSVITSNVDLVDDCYVYDDICPVS